MKTEDFKNKLFITLLDREWGTDNKTLQDLVNKTNLAYAKLHGEDIPLEDIRNGEFSKVTLGDAVEKLAFELQNDRTFYGSYRDTLSYAIYKTIDNDEGVEINNFERLSDLAESCAESFLDKFINDTLRNKEKNEEENLEVH